MTDIIYITEVEDFKAALRIKVTEFDDLYALIGESVSVQKITLEDIEFEVFHRRHDLHHVRSPSSPSLNKWRLQCHLRLVKFAYKPHIEFVLAAIGNGAFQALFCYQVRNETGFYLVRSEPSKPDNDFRSTEAL